ncbi:hypothetical protein RB195_015320 [Necator americanus]|uniref:Uncharacterized protein n=1 Tax=Necator americanus TaxID=51031 RepID=A0ABR1E410_NECAM
MLYSASPGKIERGSAHGRKLTTYPHLFLEKSQHRQVCDMLSLGSERTGIAAASHNVNPVEHIRRCIPAHPAKSLTDVTEDKTRRKLNTAERATEGRTSSLAEYDEYGVVAVRQSMHGVGLASIRIQ